MDFSHNKRSGESGPTWLVAILLVLIGVGVVVAYYNGYVTGGVKPGSVVTSSTQPGLVSTTLPLSIINADPLAKAAIATATTITLYTPGGSFQGVCTTSSGSCTTTGYSFASGTSLIASIVTSGYVTEWIPFTVPYVPSGAAGITTIPVQIYQLKTESYASTFMIGTTAISTANQAHVAFTYKYNFSTTAAQPVTISLNYKTANEGYLSCNQAVGLQYDIISKVCQSAVLQISDAGAGLSVTGMPREFPTGSSRYWWALPPDGVGIQPPTNGGMGLISQFSTPGAGPHSSNPDSNTGGSLTEQTIGNNIYGGTATVGLTVQQGSVASSSTEALVFTLYINADPNYFPVNNNLGPNAVNASTPWTVTFKAH